MLWVSVIFLGATAVLVTVAWWLRRKLDLGRAEPRDDAVDSWLIQHYRLLAWPDRCEVREAVRRGRVVGDPALGRAAHALAAELLSGRLRDRQPGALVLAGINVLSGALLVGTDLARHGTVTWIGICVGAAWLLGAVTWVWCWRRPPLRNVRRALRANGGGA
jgi:hypothetical protein